MLKLYNLFGGASQWCYCFRLNFNISKLGYKYKEKRKKRIQKKTQVDSKLSFPGEVVLKVLLFPFFLLTQLPAAIFIWSLKHNSPSLSKEHLSSDWWGESGFELGTWSASLLWRAHEWKSADKKNRGTISLVLCDSAHYVSVKVTLKKKYHGVFNHFC